MKVVINRCYGGFGLSKEAYEFLGVKWDGWGASFGTPENPGYRCSEMRSDAKLVECVEKLGEKASSRLSNLTVIEIPDGVEYVIEEYDGIEWVAEKHRTWGDGEEE